MVLDVTIGGRVTITLRTRYKRARAGDTRVYGILTGQTGLTKATKFSVLKKAEQGRQGIMKFSIKYGSDAFEIKVRSNFGGRGWSDNYTGSFLGRFKKGKK